MANCETCGTSCGKQGAHRVVDCIEWTDKEKLPKWEDIGGVPFCPSCFKQADYKTPYCPWCGMKMAY